MIHTVKEKIKNIFLSTKVGTFLGVRQIKRGNVWISVLIISIMTLTFLSLVVVPGILVGLTEGSFQQNREQLTGDLYLTTLPGESNIWNTQDIVRTLKTIPEVDAYALRYKTGTTVRSGYIMRDDFTEDSDSVSIQAVAINPQEEDATTGISQHIIEGEMLRNDESGYILIGSTLLKKYSKFSDMFEPLRYVEVGKPVLVTFTGTSDENDVKKGGKSGLASTNDDEDALSGSTTEFIVKGIVDSKVGDVSSSVFITEGDYRRITGDTSLQADEIAIKHKDGISDDAFKKIIESYGFGEYAKIQTAEEAIPKFLSDVQKTFSLLGNLTGLIGIIVSSITIFIVIYINAITRRKFIGILKGIGVSEPSIEFSYIIQSLFYSVFGILLGVLVLYGVLVPYFNAHPIDFPMSDGVIIAEPFQTAVRAFVLLIVSLIAGFVPARLVVQKNTLDSILQR